MNDIPSPSRERPQRGAASPAPSRRANARISMVWAIPVIVLIVTLALAWNAYSSRGQIVSVGFEDATGITPGETTLKFREVTVGKVETVRFTDDLSRVIVDIRVEPSVAEFIGADAKFWVVRPEVTTSGISRLDTVLSGTFIEGDWTAVSTGPRPQMFTGMERSPLIRSRDEGSWVVLSAPSASGLSEGAPITFRGLKVGRMENLRLSDDDETVLIDVFIEAPYNQRLTTATVFWDVSGFSVSLGANGLALNVNSVVTLLQGGASFGTFASGGTAVSPGHRFRLYPDLAAAEESFFGDDEGDQVRVSLLLPGELRGVEVGTDIQLGGLTVGRVTDLAVTVPETGVDAGNVMQQVTAALSPARLGLPPDADSEMTLAWLEQRVASGLRARPASGGFLGISVIIELLEVDDAPAATIDMAALPYPAMPVIEGNVQDMAGTAQGFLTRIGDLPLDETLKSAQAMMNSITAIAASEDTKQIPASLRAVLGETEAAVEEIRTIVAELNEQAAASKLTKAFDDTAAAMDAVRIAAEEIPDMVDKIEATVDEVQMIDYENLGNSVQKLSDTATGLVDDLRVMLGTDDAAQLPADLSQTLKSASALMTDLREGGAVGNLNAMLASARKAADQVETALAGFPDLTSRARAMIARSETVIASYGERSAFNNEMLALMRELRRASSNFGSLARMIERNPRAFILGR